MNEITIFENEQFGQVRTVEINNEPWFVGKDVVDALGYQNGSRDLKRHVADEDRNSISLFDGTQNREWLIINESGLYSLIFGSKLDTAKEFKHWVTHDVLPSIRKTGSFTVETTPSKSDAEIRNEEKALKLESAKFLHELASSYSNLPSYKQILDAYATKELVGDFVLPLPEVKKNEMYASEVGKILGISKQKVGQLANKYGLKTEEFGVLRMDKSPYSPKEVPNFFYYDNAIDKLRECLELEAKEKEKVKTKN